jgi:hypothetical protein
MGRPVDMLDHIERSEQIRQTDSIRVSRCLDMDTEVAANHDWAGLQYKRLDNGGQLIEKQTQRSSRSGSVYRQKNKRLTIDSYPYTQSFECRHSWQSNLTAETRIPMEKNDAAMLRIRFANGVE